jgi:4-amino-4-deoxy-L-arabinose transferase-like glycosyltransferase
MVNNRTSRWLLWILVVSVAIRVVVAVMMGNQVDNLPGIADQLSYHNLALRVLGGHGFSFGENWWPATRANEPTAHWSFLYTLCLVIIYRLFGPYPLAARLIQAVIVGLLHPWLVYLLGSKVFSPVVGLVGAGLTAIYAYFIYYGAALMTEPFYTLAILGALYLAMILAEAINPANEKPHGPYRTALGLGLCLGIAVLMRQLLLLFVPFLLLWVWWVGGRKRLAPVLVPLLLMIAMILPVTAYNYSRFHRFVLLNTNAGYAFFWGNHPIYGTHFIPILPSSTYYQLIPTELLPLDEARIDQALLKRGLDFIRQDPIRYLKLSLSRIPAYFMFWPSADSSMVSNIARVGSFGILWPFMLAGLILGVLSWRKSLAKALASPGTLLVLFIVVYAGIHLLSWALIRYRLPIDAVLVIYAASAFVELRFWFAARYSRKMVSTSLGKERVYRQD